MLCRRRLSSTPLIRALARILRLGRPHWRLLIAAFGCMVVVGLTTGAYAWLMGPALEFLLTGGTKGLSSVARWLPDDALTSRERMLWGFPIVIVVIGALKGVGYLGQFYWVGLFGQQVVVDLRRALFARYLALTPLQRSTRLSGDLLSRFTNDIAAVEQAATYTVASWLRDSVQVVILVGVAFSVSWQLSLLALVAVPIAIIPASRLTAALMRRTREGQAALGTLAGQVQEGLGALRSIQAFDGQAAEMVRFDHVVEALRRAMTRAGWARAAVPGVMEVLAAIAIAGTLGWAASTGAVAGPALVNFLGAIILMYQPAKDLGRVSQFAIVAAASLERIDDVLRLEQRVVDAVDAKPLPRLQSTLTLDDVHFSWGERRALAGLSLRIDAGTTVGIVGPSGSGKSTLVALLLRLEKPTRGSISIDGVNVDQATIESVRAQFALVTQEPLLFSGTVRENLLLAKPHATQTDLDDAMRTAQAFDFIKALPQGLDTPIGERGVTLSGGQRQRLCLARAVLSGAPVLILDEATSNLDAESERDVQRALESVRVGRTMIIIAHRESALRDASQLIRLEAPT